jgi:hypothetical protein
MHNPEKEKCGRPDEGCLNGGCLSGSSLLIFFLEKIINSGEAVMQFINNKFIVKVLLYLPNPGINVRKHKYLSYMTKN